jgi:hypothetical protein
MEDIFNKIAEATKPTYMETETIDGKHFIYTKEVQTCIQDKGRQILLTIVGPCSTTYHLIEKSVAKKMAEIFNQL